MMSMCEMERRAMRAMRVMISLSDNDNDLHLGLRSASPAVTARQQEDINLPPVPSSLQTKAAFPHVSNIKKTTNYCRM